MAVARRGRVQLEGAVDDLDLVAVLEVGQRPLQAPLPDEAPGTDDVAPDLDPHDQVNTANGGVPFPPSQAIVYPLGNIPSKES